MNKRTTSRIMVAGIVMAWASACSDAPDEELDSVKLGAAPPARNVDLKGFLKCLKDNLKKGDSIDKAVACLPGNCTMTLVMSPSSAQPACAPPAGEQKCQLPRVLLSCGDPRFEPSFSLCPTSANDGMKRIEVCQGMAGTNDTEMADIATFIKGFDETEATLEKVLSYPVNKADIIGTKGCNGGDCHLHKVGNRNGSKLGENNGLLSTPVPPRALDVIFTNDPKVKEALEKAQKDPKFKRRPGTKDEDLASICKCIDDNKGKAPFTEESGKLALALCNALKDKVGGAGGGAGGVGGAGGSSGASGASGQGGVGGEAGTQANDAGSGTDAGSSEGGSAGSDGTGGFGGSLQTFDASVRGSVPLAF